MEKVDTLVVDKTGTLTEGKPSVVSIKTGGGMDETTLLRLAASLERSSEHPLAAAIVRAATERGLVLAQPDDFDSPVGKGVSGIVEGRKLVIGNRRIMSDAGIDTAALEGSADELRSEGATAIFVAIDGKAAGVVAIADPVKATTPAAIAALKEAGIRVVMLTGDNATTAKAVAQKLGISEVEADVLPEEKGKVVERLRAQGRVVAMAGDGVNDAPALAAADVGIAMGTGHRRCHGKRRCHAAQGRSHGHRARAKSVGGDHGQYPPEPVLRLHLQRRRRSDRSRRALPLVRRPAVSDHRRGRDGPVIGQRDRQRAAAQPRDGLGRMLHSQRWVAAMPFARSMAMAIATPLGFSCS